MGKEVIIDTQTIIEKRQSIGKSEHKGFSFFSVFFLDLLEIIRGDLQKAQD